MGPHARLAPPQLLSYPLCHAGTRSGACIPAESSHGELGDGSKQSIRVFCALQGCGMREDWVGGGAHLIRFRHSHDFESHTPTVPSLLALYTWEPSRE